MATVLDFVTQALCDAKVYGAGQEPDAEDGAFCLDVFNQMLTEWEIEGIDLAHIDVALTDTLDVPDSHRGPIRRSLAVRIAEAFGTEITPAMVALAEAGERALRAYHFSIAGLTCDHPLAQNRAADNL